MTTTTTTAIDDLLAAIASGCGMAASDLYSEDAVLDATVPGWRFSVRGNRAIGYQYAEWYAVPGRFDELDRRTTPGGEVVTYLLTWAERGVPHAAHHCHVLTLADDGRILRDVFFCGGRWDAALLARMDEADNG